MSERPGHPSPVAPATPRVTSVHRTPSGSAAPVIPDTASVSVGRRKSRTGVLRNDNPVTCTG
ncbi:hypothetical protein [Kitasatospora cineracea]|uniref:hypothetical protein n=1 Tax=Kitasatospora cineracea TaxID=88074 RepID=UPI003411530D